MTRGLSSATDWSTAFLTQLVEEGVRHIVVSPGSRSQALALAADALASSGLRPVRLHVVIDERSAAFFGLGLALQTLQPTVLMCTSGSAPAHYLPALLEAKHSGIPLIAVTADRPEELQGVGANQTTTQAGMFGPATHSVFDVATPIPSPFLHTDARQLAVEVLYSALSGAPNGRSGPVQVNVGFREPLSAPITEGDIEEVLSEALPRNESLAVPPTSFEPVIDLTPEPGTAVVAGHRAGPEAELLARELGAVLFAEVHSGARLGPHLAIPVEKLLQSPPEGQTLSRVICVGRPTLSRSVNHVLSSVEIEQIVWQKGEPEASNLSGTARIANRVSVTRRATESEIRQWVRPWITESRRVLGELSAGVDPAAPDVESLASETVARRAEFATKEMEVMRKALSRRDIAREVWEATWPDDELILSSSRMIREFDGFVPGKKISVWSSRGISGIDGTLATARGIAAARKSFELAGVTRVVLGDLALLHDVGSLLTGPAEFQDSRFQAIVVRDGGGSIFDSLDVFESAPRESFDRVIFSPSSADFAALARAYGWAYRHAETLGDFIEALANSRSPLLIDCSVPR